MSADRLKAATGDTSGVQAPYQAAPRNADGTAVDTTAGAFRKPVFDQNGNVSYTDSMKDAAASLQNVSLPQTQDDYYLTSIPAGEDPANYSQDRSGYWHKKAAPGTVQPTTTYSNGVQTTGTVTVPGATASKAPKANIQENDVYGEVGFNVDPNKPSSTGTTNTTATTPSATTTTSAQDYAAGKTTSTAPIEKLWDDMDKKWIYKKDVFALKTDNPDAPQPSQAEQDRIWNSFVNDTGRFYTEEGYNKLNATNEAKADIESGDPYAQTANALTPTNPLDYTGDIYVDETEEGRQYLAWQQEMLKNNPAYSAFDQATGTISGALGKYDKDQTELINSIKEAAKTSPEAAELWGVISSRLKGLNDGDLAGYQDALYQSAYNPVAREAARMERENAARLAGSGLGTSTIVNDVNSGVQRELLGRGSDLSFSAAAKARELDEAARKDAMQQGNFWTLNQGNLRNDNLKLQGTAQGDYLQNMGQGASALATIGAGKYGVGQDILNNINNYGAREELREMNNINYGINEFDQRRKNTMALMGLPAESISATGGLLNAGAQANAAKYQADLSAAANKQSTLGSLFGMLGTVAGSWGKK